MSNDVGFVGLCVFLHYINF